MKYLKFQVFLFISFFPIFALANSNNENWKPVFTTGPAEVNRRVSQKSAGGPFIKPSSYPPTGEKYKESINFDPIPLPGITGEYLKNLNLYDDYYVQSSNGKKYFIKSISATNFINTHRSEAIDDADDGLVKIIFDPPWNGYSVYFNLEKFFSLDDITPDKNATFQPNFPTIDIPAFKFPSKNKEFETFTLFHKSFPYEEIRTYGDVTHQSVQLGDSVQTGSIKGYSVYTTKWIEKFKDLEKNLFKIVTFKEDRLNVYSYDDGDFGNYVDCSRDISKVFCFKKEGNNLIVLSRFVSDNITFILKKNNKNNNNNFYYSKTCPLQQFYKIYQNKKDGFSLCFPGKALSLKKKNKNKIDFILERPVFPHGYGTRGDGMKNMIKSYGPDEGRYLIPEIYNKLISPDPDQIADVILFGSTPLSGSLEIIHFDGTPRDYVKQLPGDISRLVDTENFQKVRGVKYDYFDGKSHVHQSIFSKPNSDMLVKITLLTFSDKSDFGQGEEFQSWMPNMELYYLGILEQFFTFSG